MAEQLAYIDISPFRESDRSRLMIATRKTDAVKAVLKTAINLNGNDYGRIYNEFNITNTIKGLIHPWELDIIENAPYLVRPFIEGVTLRELIGNDGMDIRDFFPVAIALTENLGLVHSFSIIHKDINPDNVLWIEEKKTCIIIDFDIATQLSLKADHKTAVQALEGTLPYISPEQTGRMNRVVDYRTDLYSLGICFYEMLTGHVPFETGDSLELVHSHIAKTPVALDELNFRIPSMLSKMVMKLMAKNADDRYQSCSGLKSDLLDCERSYLAKQTIDDFELGSHDVSSKFLIPQKLYGRGEQVELLLQSFLKIAGGERGLVLVSGYSGVGKTSIVYETHRPISEHNGIFIDGKFDQLQHNIPYHGWSRALNQLVAWMLTENENVIEEWKKKFQQALGPVSKALTDVFPALRQVMFVEEDLPELSSREAQNRFNYAFRTFIQTIAAADHPLVIFLDDFQWADTASLDLWKTIMLDESTAYLMVIGAYRSNEVDARHPFILTQEEIAAGFNHPVNSDIKSFVSSVSVYNLSETDMGELVADTLRSSAANVQKLTQLIYSKTLGNAFFTTQFLKSLYQDDLIHFDLNVNQWTWNYDRIVQKNITDNVVELMTGKVKKLSAESQRVLRLASCIGGEFDLQTLSVIYGKPVKETGNALWDSIVEGLVIPDQPEYHFINEILTEEAVNFTFRFVHDRIQQAAYSLIPETEKVNYHLQIGRLLLNNLSEEETGKHIFDIVSHFNRGFTAITDDREKEKLLQLNFGAGVRAKQANAYESALNYFMTASRLSREDVWTSHYDFELKLKNELAECAYLSGHTEIMEKTFNEVVLHAKSLLEKVKVYETKILTYATQQRLKEAAYTAMEILGKFGIRFPANPKTFHIVLGMIKTRIALKGRSTEQLLQLPEMTDPVQKGISNIKSVCASSFFLALPNHYPLLIFQQVRQSLKYGNNANSSLAYGPFGLILCGIVGDIKHGAPFGTLMLRIVEKFKAKELEARTQFINNFFILQWSESLKNGIENSISGFKSGLETGDLEYAAYCLFVKSDLAFLSGEPLEPMLEEWKDTIQFMKQHKQTTQLIYCSVYAQACFNLLNEVEKPWELKGDFYNEDEMVPVHRQVNDHSSLASLYGNKLLLAFLSGEMNLAVEFSDEVTKYWESTKATPHYSYMLFYRSLICLNVFANSEMKTRKRFSKIIKDTIHKMEKWSVFSPSNFSHRAALLKAEWLRLHKKNEEAKSFYEKAVSEALKNGYISEEAQACELAGRFYLVQGNEAKARELLARSVSSFNYWGGRSKAKKLNQEFSALLRDSGKSGATISRTMAMTSTIHAGSMSTSATGIDILTIVKSSQTISRELELQNLLKKLMQIVIENAGAEKGFLLLNRNNELYIEASADSGTVSVNQSIPVKEFKNICHAIVYYTAHSHENVVLDDARSASQFIHDPYLKNKQVLSVLCTPIELQAKLVGVLYLENNLVTGAFTGDRVEILSLLTTQAAISLENAKLYNDLRSEVGERIKAQEEVKRSEERLTQYLEGVTIGVFVIDRNGKPFYANKTAQDLLGKGIISTAGKENLSSVYEAYQTGTGQIYPAGQLPIVKALQGETSMIDDMEIHQDGKVIPVEVSATPIYDDKNQIIYAIAAFQDITQRLLAKKQLEEYSFTLEQKVKERTEELVQQKSIIEEEKQKSDSLLLNILPAQVMEELKRTGRTNARSYNLVTVLFADFKDFTLIADELTPEELVSGIDEYFEMFDLIIEKYPIEKIKTVGDAYICAAGLPVPNNDNAVIMINAAVEMLAAIEKLSDQRKKSGKVVFEVRMGVHSGPVVAGVVGIKKFQYDIWGDAVNTAARMQQNGEPNRINISGTTNDLIKHRYKCEYRGRVEAKHKGEIDMYFVVGRKAGAQLVDYAGAEQFMLKKLERELPSDLTYHGIHHTKDVMQAALKIADREGVNNEEDLKLLRVAIAFHDAGFLFAYRGHEEKGCEMAKELLPSYGFDENAIQRVCGLISATRLPQQPTNFLEEIIADADLDYLGRDDFYPISKTLYQEFKRYLDVKDEEQWNNIQYNFLTNHHYFTSFGRSFREANKQQRLKEIEALVKSYKK